MIIEKISKNNKQLKNDIKLNQKKYRDLENEYLLFGQTLVKEALLNKKVKRIYVTEELEDMSFSNIKKIDNDDLLRLTKGANTKVVCVCEKNKEFLNFKNKDTIILDNIQDPGNMGTIIRTAKSFGFDNVIVSKDSVDIYGDKALRSMQGVHFSINIVKMDIEKYLQESENTLVTTFLDEESTFNPIEDSQKNNIDLVFGNEGHGIRDEIKKYERYNYKIPIHFESINVAIAAAIVMYEIKKGELCK